jgi:hypothetical protein
MSGAISGRGFMRDNYLMRRLARKAAYQLLSLIQTMTPTTIRAAIRRTAPIHGCVAMSF